MNKVSFTVHGEPTGKGRPKFARRGSFACAYTPRKTVEYENRIKAEYQRQCGNHFFEKDIPLRMEIMAYYGVPKNVSMKKAKKMIAGEIKPLKKPDSSNVLKAVEDALNGIAYHDDCQIVETVVNRYYGNVPRVEVCIIECEK